MVREENQRQNIANPIISIDQDEKREKKFHQNGLPRRDLWAD
jgi:hypothetical protein